MLRICDIDMAIDQAKQDARVYQTDMQVWYDHDQDCYYEIRDDVIDNRKHNGQWRLIFDVDQSGAETFY